jgi:hypothetical protein
MPKGNRDGKVTLFFRPEKVVLGGGAFRGRITDTTFAGATKHIVIRTGEIVIKASMLNQNPFDVGVGSEVSWDIPAEAITLLPAK